MVLLTLLIDFTGALCFLAAFVVTWETIPQMQRTRIYWITFSFAMLIGFAWTLSLVLVQLGVAVEIMRTWQQPLLAVAVSELVINSILAYAAQARPYE